METMNWVSKRDLSPSVTGFFTWIPHKCAKLLICFETPKATNGFNCTLYHNVTLNSCIFWLFYFSNVLDSTQVRCSTKQRLFLWVPWLITVPLVCSLSMCRIHFRMPVGVLCAYEEEAIGDGICHVALRRKVCPQIF